jgi:hypothetical protein
MTQPESARQFRAGYAQGAKDFAAGVPRAADPYEGEVRRGWQIGWVTRQQEAEAAARKALRRGQGWVNSKGERAEK